MGYNDAIDRTGAESLVPEQVAADIIGHIPDQSAVAQMFRTVPMSTNQTRMPVLATLPIAYFVSPTDSGLKETTDQSWTDKFLNVEELAAIVPIPQSVLDDSSFDIWAQVRPNLEEAIARKIDNAAFFGVDAPVSWPTDINAAAATANNGYEEGTNASTAGGFMADLDGVLAALEADGFDGSAWLADRTFKAKLRGARDADGQRLDQSRVSPNLGELDGSPVIYNSMRGQWPLGLSGTRAFVGDWQDQFVFGLRQDITYTVTTEGVITDNLGAVVLNLFQQDMVALRVVMRCAWQVANPLTFEQPTEADRYPVSALTLPAA